MGSDMSCHWRAPTDFFWGHFTLFITLAGRIFGLRLPSRIPFCQLRARSFAQLEDAETIATRHDEVLSGVCVTERGHAC